MIPATSSAPPDAVTLEVFRHLFAALAERSASSGRWHSLTPERSRI